MKTVIFLTLAFPLAAQSWKPLFNGKDLTGWESRGDGLWSVMADGTLLGQRGPLGKPPSTDVNSKIYKDWLHNQAWLFTTAEYSEFDLRLEYWLPVGGNSGVALRDPSRAQFGIQTPPDFTRTPAKSAYEVQINNGYPGDPNLTGSIYNLAIARDGLQRPHDWNQLEISVRNDKITVRLNGQPAAGCAPAPGRPARGYIGLQLHDRLSLAMFRRIQIRVP